MTSAEAPRIQEHIVSKVIRAGSQAAGLALATPIGRWATESLMNIEKANVSENILNPNVAAETMFVHLNHLAELNLGWSSMGVDAAQILIGGVLLFDSLAVDKEKPMTVGRTFTEAVTTMAAMASPVLLTEIVNIAQNAIELDHLATTFGEVAIFALGAYKIGSAVNRIFNRHKQSKLDHLAKKQKLAKMEKNPGELKVMTDDFRGTLIEMHTVEHNKNKELKIKLRVKEGRQLRENKEYKILHPTPPTEAPQVERGVLTQKLRDAGAYSEESQQPVEAQADGDDDVPTFLRNRK